MTPFKRWLTTNQITAAEKRQLATAAGLSMSYLYLLTNGHRQVSTAMAARLEQASLDLSRVRDGTATVLRRSYLSPVCNACPHRPGAPL